MAAKPRVVVVAVDASENSENALQFYLDHVHHDNNYLYVVTCMEYNFLSADYELSSTRLEEELSQIRAEAESIRDKLEPKLKARGADGEFVVLQDGKPAHAIVEFANQKSADVIVTGTRGLGKIRRTILGSVSDYIVHHSLVPVLVFRQK